MTDTTRPAPHRPGNEEPELAFEESIPLDGNDPEGEKMIEDLGQDKPREAPPEPPAEPLPDQFPAS
ncbi:MAG: hypothetical protein EOP82_14660 [Variovorax sp.]|nr:MAG: hypothetical protein EOP82_14660 [Variovorax sp.]